MQDAADPLPAPNTGGFYGNWALTKLNVGNSRGVRVQPRGAQGRTAGGICEVPGPALNDNRKSPAPAAGKGALKGSPWQGSTHCTVCGTSGRGPSAEREELHPAPLPTQRPAAVRSKGFPSRRSVSIIPRSGTTPASNWCPVSFARVIRPVIATFFRPPWAHCGQTNISFTPRGQSSTVAGNRARCGESLSR